MQKKSNILTINKKAIADNFNRAASTYDEAAVLQYEVGKRLLTRCQWVKLSPETVLDIGASTGKITQELYKQLGKPKTIGLDIAENMLQLAKKRNSWLSKIHYVAADCEAIPLPNLSVDMIFSNLTIQWCSNLEDFFHECMRVLRPGGLLMFTTLGPDTLIELRRAWQAVDDQAHINSFIDMHHIGDLLLKNFQDPVMDCETITMTYESVMAIMRDLKAIGAINGIDQRRQSLTGKNRLKDMIKHYEQFRSPENRLPVTYEIVYGHAFKPKTSKQQKQSDGSITIPFSAINKRK